MKQSTQCVPPAAALGPDMPPLAEVYAMLCETRKKRIRVEAELAGLVASERIYHSRAREMYARYYPRGRNAVPVTRPGAEPSPQPTAAPPAKRPHTEAIQKN